MLAKLFIIPFQDIFKFYAITIALNSTFSKKISTYAYFFKNPKL